MRWIHRIAMMAYITSAVGLFSLALGIPAHEIASWFSLAALAAMASDHIMEDGAR